MFRPDILAILQKEFSAAQERAELAGRRFNEIVSEGPSGLPRPDGAQRLRSASIEYAEARTAFMVALRQLNSFALYGTIPEDLKDRQV